MNRTVISVTPGALQDYDEWMKEAAHGDVLVYWTGDLQFDRLAEFDERDQSRDEDRKRVSVLNALADRVRAAAKRKELALTQKRVGEMQFEYRATRLRSSSGPTQAKARINNENLVLA